MTLKKRLEKLEAKAPPKTVWPADNIERRKVSALIPYARNARTHSDAQVAQIAASIREWGWTNPVLIDAEGGLIAGHGRVLAARKLGIEDVPCMIATGWSDAQKKAYILADNQLALNAGWDMEFLAVELGELAAMDFDVALMGFPNMAFDAEPLGEYPTLPDGNKAEFQQMTFTLHDSQAEEVKAALDAAKAMGAFDSPNENSNGNALARVCETFLTVAGEHA
jgi:ParB family chromosome partitioning protein